MKIAPFLYFFLNRSVDYSQTSNFTPNAVKKTVYIGYSQILVNARSTPIGLI